MVVRLSPPNHREAYPRIEYLAASAGSWEGRVLCVWRSHKGGRVGHARIVLTDADTLIRYRVNSLYGAAIAEGMLALQFDEASLGLGRKRMMLLCPVCQRRCASIYIKEREWACDKCHRLTYKSKLIQVYSRDYLRWQELHEHLKDGRPKGQHQSTYLGLRSDLQHLSEKVGLRPTDLNADVVRQISASWIKPEDDEEWRAMPYFSDEFEG